MNNKSEVARLREQIAAEWNAACLGLSGLSRGSSTHKVITGRMERVAELQLELRRIDEQADDFLIGVMEGKSE